MEARAAASGTSFEGTVGRERVAALVRRYLYASTAFLLVAGALGVVMRQSQGDLARLGVLWFFGHPVVYLLLFPAVAVYYLLIPRYAGRELVAGRIVAVAWLIGVVSNVVIWAHHVYLDYPDDTIQAQLNLAMQPLTFTITLVSALSLYSLSATIYRSRFGGLRLDTARVLEAIKRGGAGAGGMPANLVTGADADTVADFVAQSAGR